MLMLISYQLEDGDIRAAIRLAASDDTLAPFDDVTAEALRSRPPVSHPVLHLAARRQQRIPNVCSCNKSTSWRKSSP